jgi:hypothetical protein
MVVAELGVSSVVIFPVAVSIELTFKRSLYSFVACRIAWNRASSSPFTIAFTLEKLAKMLTGTQPSFRDRRV